MRIELYIKNIYVKRQGGKIKIVLLSKKSYCLYIKIFHCMKGNSNETFFSFGLIPIFIDLFTQINKLYISFIKSCTEVL